MAWVRKVFKTLGAPAVLTIGFFVVMAIFGNLLSPYDPNAQDLLNASQSFSTHHILGTDHLGRDTASRLIKGAQTTLLGVSIILVLAASVGLTIGTISGYFGGWVDEVLMRIVD